MRDDPVMSATADSSCGELSGETSLAISEDLKSQRFFAALRMTFIKWVMAVHEFPSSEQD